MIVREASGSDIATAVEIARALPQWFTPRGIASIEVDLPLQHVLIATDDDDEPIGFLAWVIVERVARIVWMGVRPDSHRCAAGRALVTALVDRLTPLGASEIHVDTLGDAVEYEPYARTRAFYRGVGFHDHLRVQTGDPECEERLTLAMTLTPLDE